MTAYDLRTRAERAAAVEYLEFSSDTRENKKETAALRAAFIDGAEWHAAQQPTREQIARAIAESDDQPDLTGEQAVHHYGHVALAVLALLDGAGS